MQNLNTKFTPDNGSLLSDPGIINETPSSSSRSSHPRDNSRLETSGCVSRRTLQVSDTATTHMSVACRLPCDDDVRYGLPYLGNDLLKQIADQANIDKAWEQVLKDDGVYLEAKGRRLYKGKRRKRKAPGIDGLTTLETYRKHMEAPIAICEDLLTGKYVPQPVRRVMIDKPNGGQRPLGIPTVMDKVVQRAVLQILEPAIDPFFSNHSHGFRHNHSVHQAAEQVLNYKKKEMKYAVDLDLSSYFDTVDHTRLLHIISILTDDAAFIHLIERILDTEVIIDGVLQQTTAGTPQGGVLSPFLANLFLHPFDRELEQNGNTFVRYADDIVIFCKSRRVGNRILRRITRTFEGYGLKVNEAKTSVLPSEELEFLGLSYSDFVILSAKSMDKFKENIRILTKRGSNAKVNRNMAKFISYLNGWFAHYGRLQTPDQARELNTWLTKRINRQIMQYHGNEPDPMSKALPLWQKAYRRYPHWKDAIELPYPCIRRSPAAL